MTTFQMSESQTPGIYVATLDVIFKGEVGEWPANAKIDTGAEYTCIPFGAFSAITRQPYLRMINYLGQGGSGEMPLYEVDILVAGRPFASVIVGGMQHNRVVLGMNFLNLLKTSLDGPGKMFQL